MRRGDEGPFLLSAILRGIRGERFGEADLSQEASQLDWSEVLRLAFENRVASLLCHTLAPAFSSGRIPRQQVDVLKGFFLETTQKNLRIRHSLNLIVSKLADLGIEVIVLKGADLAFTIWPHMATRQMHDIDIVVPVDRVQETIDVLLELGYERTRGFSVEWHLSHSKEVWGLVEPKSGIEVEIHYRFFTPNPRIKVDETPFWKNTQSREFGGVPAKVLAPEELLVLLCLHVSVGHFLEDNMRSLLDIRLLMGDRGKDMDRSKIDLYLDDPHTGPLLAFPIFICNRFLETDFRPVIDDAGSVLSRHYSGVPLAVMEKSAERFLLKNKPETLLDWILVRLATVAIYDSEVGLAGLTRGFFADQKKITRIRDNTDDTPLAAIKSLIQRRTRFAWNLIRAKLQ